MPTVNWTGLGLADNTVLSNGNLNTTGNGTGTLVFQALSGTSPVRVTQQSADGNGVTISGSDTALCRLDTSAISGGAECMSIQALYKAPAAPTTNHNFFFVGRNANATQVSSAQVCHTLTTNRIEFRDTTNTIATSAVSGSATTAGTPVLVAGDVYQVDMAAIRNTLTTPSTSNGRILGRVRSITAPGTWNAGAEFWFDTGYTANVTVDKTTFFRTGKAATAGAVASFDFLNLQWRDLATPDTSLTKANAITNFVQVAGPTISTTGTGAAYVIYGVGTAAFGGALTHSITQTSGTTHAATLITTGVWRVDQDTSSATGYDVTVAETGFGTTTTSFVVPALTATTAGQFRRRKLVSGVWT